MTADPERPGLYVHVPFCSSKCIHCGFFSLPFARRVPDWLEALALEAAVYAASFPAFETLYLGGGTPSLLSVPQLSELFDLLRRCFSFLPRAETTLEMNPEDASPDKIRAVMDLGVNRLNLGVQSLDDRHLEFMGRRHNAAQSQEAVRDIRAAGCVNLGVDLIYGLPGQTASSWLETLDRILEYNPEHLSCYQLTVESATLLERKVLQREIVLPGEEQSREFFLATSAHLTRAGYLHYEVSNFARGEEHVSGHNSKYWRREPYLGLGPAAHSFLANRRWWNHRSLKQYLADLGSGRRPLAGEELVEPGGRISGNPQPGPPHQPGNRPEPAPALPENPGRGGADRP